jgi:hypothetical protein
VVAKQNGSITVDGRCFYFDGLVTYLKSRYVKVRVPKYEDWPRLPVYDMQGNHLGFAEEDEPFAYFDPAGAQESGRRRALEIRKIRELGKSAPDIDILSEVLSFSANAPKALPAPVDGHISATEDEKAVAHGLKETPKARRKREEEERQQEVETQRHLYEDFAAKAVRQAKNR